MRDNKVRRELTPRMKEVLGVWSKNNFKIPAAARELGVSESYVSKIVYDGKNREFISELRRSRTEVAKSVDVAKLFLSPQWLLGEILKIYQSIPEISDLTKMIRNDCKDFIETHPEDRELLDDMIKRIEENTKIFINLSKKKEDTLKLINMYQKDFGDSLNEENVRIMTMSRRELAEEAEKLIENIRNSKEADWKIE